MIKKFLLFLSALMAFQNGIAQKIAQAVMYDTVVYVYKLNQEQSEFLIRQGQITDTTLLFRNVWKEFQRASFKPDSLPEGNFISLAVDQEMVSYHFIQHLNFTSRTRIFGDEVVVFLQDISSGQLIEQAKMDIDGESIPFDEGYGGYRFSHKDAMKHKTANGQHLIRIQYKNSFTLYRYYYQAPEPPPVRDGNAYQSGLSEGYLISDKPVYRALDTLKLKAFLTEPRRGRPIRRKAWLSISEPMQNFNLTRKLKPVSPGAFVFNWPIPDSFKIDRNLNMSFNYRMKGFNLSKSYSVYLENYQLDQNNYELLLHNEIYYAGEDIAYSVVANDANGFPIPGTQIHCKLSIQNIFEFLGDSLKLSAARKANWYSFDTLFPYEASMALKIPSNLLPEANATYLLEVTFTDPVSYERKVLTKSFTKYLAKEKLLFYQQEDSLHIRNLYNLHDTNRSYRLISLSNKDTLFNRMITTPCHIQLSPFNTRFVLIDKDSVATPVDIVFNQLNIVHLNGKRSGDSLQVDFHFPFEEAVYYQLLKNGKRVQSGKTRVLRFRVADKSKDAYTLRFSHNILKQIDQNFYEAVFIPRLHTIQLESNLPPQAWPGQLIPVEIKASDYRNRPLKKINIAAFAVNKQFAERLRTPEITIPQQYKDILDIHPVSFQPPPQLYISVADNRLPLKYWHFKQLRLRKNEYYALAYPERDYTVLSGSIQSAIPEFAVTMMHGNKLYRPKYILLDNQPVYLTDLQKDVYSFPLSAGNHTISIRYFNKRIDLPVLTFAKNKKYWIGLNYDSLKNCKTCRITDSLPVAQPSDKEKEELYSRLLFTNIFPFDSLKMYDADDTLCRFRYTNYQPPQNLNADGDACYVTGPWTSNHVRLELQNKTFYLQTGSSYMHFYDANARQFITKSREKMKGAIFAFTEQLCTAQHLKDLFRKDTLVPEPNPSNVQYNRVADSLSRVNQEANFSQQYRSSTSSCMIYLRICNASKKNFVKAVWIINRSHPEDANFIPDIPFSPLTSIPVYSDTGKHDMYFLLNRNRVLVFHNVQLQQAVEWYVQPEKLELMNRTEEVMALPLKIYNDLTRLPMMPFYFEPEQSSQVPMGKAGHFNHPFIHGRITSQSAEPVPDALVLLEMNGVYKYGATTNAVGDFEFLEVPEGSYQLKVYHPAYRLREYTGTQYRNGMEYNFQIGLKDIQSQRPVYEFLHSDYRLSLFYGRNQSNRMQVAVYDKESRQPIQQVQIQVFRDGHEVYGVNTFSSNTSEWSTPSDEATPYQIRISKPGYTSLTLNNIHFIQDDFFLLNVFLAPFDERIPVYSKYYTTNLSDYVQQAQENRSSTAEVSEASADGRVRIEGILLDENKHPVRGVNVSLLRDHWVHSYVITDARGYFSIQDIPEGEYQLRISAWGYETQLLSELQIRSKKKLFIRCTLVETEMTIAMGAAEGPVVNEAPLYYAEEALSKNASMNAYATAPMGSYTLDQGTAMREIQFAPAMVQSYEVSADGIEAFSALPGRGDVKPRSISQLDESALKEFVNQGNGSVTRSRFSDVGFWQPNLITNKKGKAQFLVKLPDNITTWKTQWVAMGKHRLHGQDSTETKVFKPIQTQVNFPSYLYRNDHLTAKIRSQNLTNKSQEVQIRILLNDKTILQRSTELKNETSDSVSIDALSTDTLRLVSSISKGEQYRDEEVRTARVLDTDLKTVYYQGLTMDSDRRYSMQFPKDAEGELILNNALYEKIVEEVSRLEQYDYQCTEQCASKLRALLIKERINASLGKTEKLKTKISRLINQLSAYQNEDGSWGWWKRQDGIARMTLYAMEVLQQAHQQGYLNSNYSNAREWIIRSYAGLSISDQLYALYLLKKEGRATESMVNAFLKLKEENWSDADRIYWVKIRDMIGKPVTADDLYPVYLSLNQHVIRPYCGNFFHDPRASVFMAYQLFSGTSLGDEWLKMFRAQLLNGQLEDNLNTYSRACMIEALCLSAMSQGAASAVAEVNINDTLKVKSFPYRMPIESGTYQLQHKGGIVYANATLRRSIRNPRTIDSVFRVQTQWIQDRSGSTHLKAGKPCTLQIDLFAFQGHEKVMLEIPVPSGMKVVSKPSFGTYTEYRQEKMILYFDQLPVGSYRFDVDMLPVFTGTFVQAPAHCSLMYYPYISGNNALQEIQID